MDTILPFVGCPDHFSLFFSTNTRTALYSSIYYQYKDDNWVWNLYRFPPDRSLGYKTNTDVDYHFVINILD